MEKKRSSCFNVVADWGRSRKSNDLQLVSGLCEDASRLCPGRDDLSGAICNRKRDLENIPESPRSQSRQVDKCQDLRKAWWSSPKNDPDAVAYLCSQSQSFCADSPLTQSICEKSAKLQSEKKKPQNIELLLTATCRAQVEEACEKDDGVCSSYCTAAYQKSKPEGQAQAKIEECVNQCKYPSSNFPACDPSLPPQEFEKCSRTRTWSPRDQNRCTVMPPDKNRVENPYRPKIVDFREDDDDNRALEVFQFQNWVKCVHDNRKGFTYVMPSQNEIQEYLQRKF